MNLDISYAEFSFLRDLVKEKQMKIWREEFLPRLKHTVDMPRAFKMLMGRKTIYTNRGCCALLLHKFDEAERQIHKALEEADTKALKKLRKEEAKKSLAE